MSTAWKKKRSKQRALGLCNLKRRREPPHSRTSRPGRNEGENQQPVASLRPSEEITAISEEGSDQCLKCYLMGE